MEGIHGVIKKKQTKIQSRKIVNRYQGKEARIPWRTMGGLFDPYLTTHCLARFSLKSKCRVNG